MGSAITRFAEIMGMFEIVAFVFDHPVIFVVGAVVAVGLLFKKGGPATDRSPS